MNKRRTQFLSMGIPSMFVIFSVLCLVILALLTLGTSRQDLQAAQVSLKQTTDYCNACTQASAQYQNIVAAARDAACASSDKSDYLSRMKNLVKDFSDISLTWDSTNQTASFVLDYSDSQGLSRRSFSPGRLSPPEPGIPITDSPYIKENNHDRTDHT